MGAKLNWIYLALVAVLAFVALRPAAQPAVGVSVSVPSQPLAGTLPSADGAQQSLPQGLVNLNTASQAEIESLPRVGPKLAQRIIEGRPYHSLQDLDAVKGVGSKLLGKLKPLVTW